MIRVLEQPLSRSSIDVTKAAAIAKLFGMGVLTPLFHSTQLKMHEAFNTTGSDEFLAFSSRQLGKSWWLLCEAISVLIKYPGSRLLYYAPTKDKLRDIINDNLEPLQLWAPADLIRRHKSSDRWFVGGKKDPKTGKWKGVSELRLCVLERAHVDRNRGINARVPPGVLGICLEEPCFIPSEDFRYAWESVIDAQRLRHKPKVAIATTPSTDEKHYVHTQLLPKLEDLKATARYSIYDNPFLSTEDIEKIRNRVTKETFDREYLALITRSVTDTVLPEMSESLIRPLTPPPFANWQVIIDQGGVKDPSAITLNYWDHTQKCFCTFREAVLPVNSGLDQIIAAARALESFKTEGPLLRYGDAPGQVHIEYALRGYPLIQPKKGPGSFDAGIQAFRVALKNNEYAIDPSCTETIKQMISGRFNKQRTDFERTKGSHLDCVASVIYGHNEIVRSDPTPAPQHFIKQHRVTTQLDEVAASFTQLSNMFGE